MKSVIGALIVGMALCLGSMNIKAAEGEDCTFVVDPKRPTQFICIKNDRIVDLDRLSKEEAPIEHRDCQGKRSLSKDGNGMVTFSCNL